MTNNYYEFYLHSNVSFIFRIIVTFAKFSILKTSTNITENDSKICSQVVSVLDRVVSLISACKIHTSLVSGPIQVQETQLGSTSSMPSTRYEICFSKIIPRGTVSRSDLVNFRSRSSPNLFVIISAKKPLSQQRKGNHICILTYFYTKITHLVLFYSRLRLILSNDIESNPGPITNNLVISTYNLQGCGDKKKLKRVNSLFHKLPYKQSCIINLQETHFKNDVDITYHWKWGSTLSNGTSGSCGVAILYNSTFFDEIIGTDSDKEGRYCALHTRKDGETYLFVNIYAPNDHRASIDFFNNIQSKIETFVTVDPLINLVIAGDFNFVFNPQIDSIGRSQSKKEAELVILVENIMIKYNLSDSYRVMNGYGGFTWGKNNPKYVRSRLDHILVNKNLSSNIKASNVTYEFNESDHQYLFTELLISEMNFGPGKGKCHPPGMSCN